LIHSESLAQLGTGDRMMIAARFGNDGPELARCRSPRGGLERVANIHRPDPSGSLPRDFVRVGRTMFFTAFHRKTGRELYRMDLVPAGGVLAEPYGRGSGDHNGASIRLVPIGLPALGASGFQVKIGSSLPNATAVLLVGTRTSVPLGPGNCTLLVAPVQMVPTQLDNGGEVRIPMPVPNDTSMIGAEVFLQAGITDPGGCAFGTISTSHGLWVIVNR
jgi:hypothetical protein